MSAEGELDGRLYPWGPEDEGEPRGYLVRLRDDQGGIGFGEASPLPRYSPETGREVREALERSLGALRGRSPRWPSLEDPGRTRRLALAWLESHGDGLQAVPSGRFALETSLLDLLSKRAGRPCHALLSRDGRPSAPVAVNALLEARVGAQALTQAAKRLTAEGYAAFKVKVARGPWEVELTALRALRSALPAAELRLDANGAWELDEARDKLDELAPLGLRFVEQPVAAGVLPELGSCATPWAADESLREPGMAELLLESPCVAFVLKPAILGLGRTLALAELAHAGGRGVVLTHLLDGPVGLAAVAALALALGPDVCWACGLDGGPRLEGWPPLALASMRVPGWLEPSTEPGLGVQGAALSALEGPVP